MLSLYSPLYGQFLLPCTTPDLPLFSSGSGGGDATSAHVCCDQGEAITESIANCLSPVRLLFAIVFLLTNHHLIALLKRWLIHLQNITSESTPSSLSFSPHPPALQIYFSFPIHSPFFFFFFSFTPNPPLLLLLPHLTSSISSREYING